MSEFTKPVEDLGRNTADYVEARIDDLKLRTAKGLSLTLGKLLYMLLVLFIVSVILTALAVGVDRGFVRHLCCRRGDRGRGVRRDSGDCHPAEKEAFPQYFRSDVHQTFL